METIRKEDIITELEKWIGYHYCGDLRDGKFYNCSCEISQGIQKYETFFGESPDIESIIQKYYDNWNISEKMSDLKYKPKFSSHLITKDIDELYRNVKENCSKEYIESKISNSIIANFIVNSNFMRTEEITYLYMVESLKKVWNSYSIEYAPSPAPAPAPSPEQTNSIIHAVPLSQTRENEIDTLKKRVEILEKKNEELISIIAEIKDSLEQKIDKPKTNSGAARYRRGREEDRSRTYREF
jgi:hypothetical protein